MEEKKKIETRSVKTLEAAKSSSRHQKEWFMEMRERVVREKLPFVICSANFPMEILRAMDVPFVVNQWWSAICGAKQMGARYAENIKNHGYRSGLCGYCGMLYGGILDEHPEEGPWGGLPNPTIIVAESGCGSSGKIMELVADHCGAKVYRMENTACIQPKADWYDYTHYRWEEIYDEGRLDDEVEALKAFIHFIETETGHVFNETELLRVMNKVNEQEMYYYKARNLIAETYPAPVTITDTVNAVMQAQWHRGTQWAVDHAKSFYEEIKARVDAGYHAVPNEKPRLMWIGVGLWNNLAFYQHFEKKYGAAFIWSMYLAMGADQYPRFNMENDPLRALASREATMGDALGTLPMNSNWYLNEVKRNGINGVISLVGGLGCEEKYIRSNALITKQLRDMGVPILELNASAVDPRGWNQEKMIAIVENFLENEVIPRRENK